jgi:hypothetical protein
MVVSTLDSLLIIVESNLQTRTYLLRNHTMATPAEEETVLPGSVVMANSGQSYQLSEPPTDDEVAKALESPSVFGPMKKKKELIKPILENLETILRRMSRVDTVLSVTFRNGLPGNVKELESKNFSAAMLAQCLVHIKTRWTIYESLETKSFRGDETINSLFTAINEVYDQAHGVAHDKKAILCRKLMVSLKPPEKNRKFLKHGRLPEDKAFQVCLLCSHQSIDYPDSNDRVSEENDALMRNHEGMKLGWETRKASGEPVGRAPTIPKMKPIYFQCHCWQFNCLRRGGSGTCPDCKADKKITDTVMDSAANVVALVRRHTW